MIKQLGVVVIGAALMTPFMAQAEGAYVGFNAGRAQQKATVYELDDRTFKDSSTAYKLYGGYEFNKYIGVEGGYLNMGKAKYPYDYTAGSVQLKTNALYAAVTGTLPINDQFSLFGKLGVSRNRVKITDPEELITDWNYKKTRTATFIGIGAAYNFTKNMAVVAEYENFGKVAKEIDGRVKANLFSVGLRYKF